LGSLNGTFVNADRVNGQRTLKPGDEVTLGSTKCVFDAPAAAAAAEDPTKAGRVTMAAG